MNDHVCVDDDSSHGCMIWAIPLGSLWFKVRCWRMAVTPLTDSHSLSSIYEVRPFNFRQANLENTSSSVFFWIYRPLQRNLPLSSFSFALPSLIRLFLFPLNFWATFEIHGNPNIQSNIANIVATVSFLMIASDYCIINPSSFIHPLYNWAVI